MEIFVFKNGKTLGPLREQQVIDKVDRGEFSGSDLAKVEGVQEWIRLDELIVREPADETAQKGNTLQAWMQQPVRLGVVVLATGCVLMVLSRWPVLIYGPFFLGAIALSFLLFYRMRLVPAILLLACTAILPAAIWRALSSPLLAPALGGSAAPIIVAASPSPKPAAPIAAITPSPIPVPAVPTPTPEAIAAASTPAPPAPEVSPTPKPADPLDSQIAAATQAYQSARSTALDEPASPTPTPSPASSPAAMSEPMQPNSSASGPRQWQTPSPAAELDPAVIADVSSKVYLVDTGAAKGTGFLLQMSGGVYFVTNFHVASAAKALACSNPGDSFTIAAGEIDVAADRDLVRFPIRKTAGLKADTLPLLGQDAYAWGNSGGQDVVTQLDGKVLGVGPGQIEVSTAFIPGNSGGPITSGSGKVMAVATYAARDKGIPDWVKSGSRFTGTRRFGVRITDDIRWIPMLFATFQDQSKRIANAEDLLRDLASMAQALNYQKGQNQEWPNQQGPNRQMPYQQAPIKTRFMDIQGVANFVNAYNRPGWRSQSQIRQMSLDLGHSIDDIKSDMDFRYQDIKTPYLKGRLDEIEKGMAKVASYLKEN